MENAKKRQLSPIWRQSVVLSGVIVDKFGHGIAAGVASAMIHALLTEGSDITVDLHAASWIAPMVGIASVVGLPMTSYAMSRLGRRLAFILLTAPMVVGLVVVACARDIIALLLGRFLLGCSVISTNVLGSMIAAELASPHTRGMFLTLKSSVFNLGIVFSHFIGYYLHWRYTHLIAIVPFVIAIIITLTWPESPYWLAEKKKYVESERAFYWLRGKNPDSVREFEEMIRNQQKKVPTKSTFNNNFKEFFKKIKQKNFWKPTLITALGFVMMECAGRHVFPTYALLMITNMTSRSIDPFYYNISLISIITLSAFCSTFLIKRVRLRVLLFTTGLASVVLLYSTSLSLFLVFNGSLSKENSLPAIILLGLFFVTVNLCCTIMPSYIAGEIYPMEHRALGTSVTGYIAGSAMAVSLKVTPPLMQALHMHGTFACFSTGILVTLLALYFLLPETKDKTLHEIDEFFTYGKRTRVRNIDVCE